VAEYLPEEQMEAVERLVQERSRMTESDAIDLAWDVMKAVAPLVREQVAQEIMAHLPAYLARTAYDEDGWASDMQYANPEVRDDYEWVAFHGEGAVDLQHVAENAARIARGGTDG
jgi:hypothetical protein